MDREMTYIEAARILSLYATKIFSPDLQKAIMMGADALYKRSAEENSNNAPMAE